MASTETTEPFNKANRSWREMLSLGLAPVRGLTFAGCVPILRGPQSSPQSPSSSQDAKLPSADSNKLPKSVFFLGFVRVLRTVPLRRYLATS